MMSAALSKNKILTKRKEYRTFARFVCCLIFAGVSGCGPLIPSNGGQKDFFVLTDSGNQQEPASRRWKFRMLVRDAKANRFINSHKIVFSSDPSKRGFYRLAQWVEPPTKQLTSLLIERLEGAKLFLTVSRLASSAIGDIQLNTEIEQFYHDTSSRPGHVRVRVSVELIDLKRRLPIGKKEFARTLKVGEYSVEGAVAGFSDAVSQILGEVIQWTAGRAEHLSKEQSQKELY